jgi:hypothetical protein
MRQRINVFAKGNVDLHDSLLYARVGGRIVWNGLGQLVSERHPGTTVRVRHECCSRSDAMLAAGGIPAELESRHLPFVAHPLTSQFETELLSVDVDAVILSIQPDVMNALVRHPRDGYRLYPEGWENWTPEDQTWLRGTFVPEPPLSPDESMASFANVIRAVRARRSTPVLVYNMSSIVPGERIRSYTADVAGCLSVRIRRFNLALVELSRQLDVPIVDVDAIVARAGADRTKVDVVHLTGDGHGLVAAEVMDTLEDLGLFG